MHEISFECPLLLKVKLSEKKAQVYCCRNFTSHLVDQLAPAATCDFEATNKDLYHVFFEQFALFVSPLHLP